MTPAGIKANAGGQILADQRPGPNKLRREYHALSRGWLANELVRRADPRERRRLGADRAGQGAGSFELGGSIRSARPHLDRGVGAPCQLDELVQEPVD